MHFLSFYPLIFVFNDHCCLTQSAEKQGNQLHMNVYKMKGQACGGPLKAEVKELKGDLRPAPPYPSRVKSVDKGTQITPERESVRTPPLFLPVIFCYCYSVTPSNRMSQRILYISV